MLSDLQRRTAEAIVNVFETGSAVGDYARVTLLPRDPGHLTYGRSQTTLASGNLHLLVKAYCEAAGARLADELSRYLRRLADLDLSLDTDPKLRGLLQLAGDDPVMRQVQDAFFDRVYWAPAVRQAERLGLRTPLGTTVVYDGVVHGSFAAMRDRTLERHGDVASLGEADWIARYVEERRAWLSGHPIPILRRTVYRMDAFRELMDEKRWDLELPLVVRGVRIDEATLAGDAPLRPSAESPKQRTLRLRKPPMRGPDVRALQRALAEHGFAVEADGIFGRETDAALRALQKSHKELVVDGIAGPATKAALGL
jgi:chitosanase